MGATGGLQINQLGFNMLGDQFVSQSENFPNQANASGQTTEQFDDNGNLLFEHSGAPQPIIKSFFKGPIGAHANDNGHYGEAYFEVSYEDFNYAKLEFTVSRTVPFNRAAWLITEEYYWKVYPNGQDAAPPIPAVPAGEPALQIFQITEAFFLNQVSDSENQEGNNITNFSTIYNTPANDSLQPHFDLFNKRIKFCRAFGHLSWDTNPPTFEAPGGGQFTFLETPCYIKGIATLM